MEGFDKCTQLINEPLNINISNTGIEFGETNADFFTNANIVLESV